MTRETYEWLSAQLSTILACILYGLLCGAIAAGISACYTVLIILSRISWPAAVYFSLALALSLTFGNAGLKK